MLYSLLCTTVLYSFWCTTVCIAVYCLQCQCLLKDTMCALGYSVHCVLQCTLNIVLHTVCTALYFIHCTAYSVYCSEQFVQLCAVCIAVYGLHYSVYNKTKNCFLKRENFAGFLTKINFNLKL